MAKRLQYRRLVLLVALLAMGFAGLGYRLVDLQVLRHGELIVRAQQNTQREILFEPRRGDVLDTKGNLLATSVFVKTLCADPAMLGNRHAEVAHVLAPLLQTSEAALAQRLTAQTKPNEKGETSTNRYVVLKRKTSTETWQKIQAAMSGLSFGIDEKKLTNKERAFYR